MTRFRLGRATSLFGWLAILSGAAYLVVGGLGAMADTPGSLPRVLTGLVAMVVGGAIVRSAPRNRSD